MYVTLLRQMREEKGLTCGELARRSRYSRGYIGMIERGIIVPSMEARRKLAAVLNTNTDFLWPNNACPVCGHEKGDEK